MRLSILLTLTVMASVVGVLVSAQAPDATAAAKGNAENGKKIFTSYGCYQCHNYAAHGGRAGPRLAPNPIPFVAFSRHRPARVERGETALVDVVTQPR